MGHELQMMCYRKDATRVDVMTWRRFLYCWPGERSQKAINVVHEPVGLVGTILGE